jgi:acyl-CoA synthetase (AMP-forming)/AMP-acid ligase II
MGFSLVDVFRDLARERTAHPALVAGDRTLTYGDLDRRSSQVADALLSHGVSAGSRVAYLGLNAPEFFEVLVGCTKIGAVLAPVNFRLTPPEVAAVVDDTGAGVMVLGVPFASMRPDLLEAVPTLEEVVVTGDGYERWIDGRDATDPGHRSGPDDAVLQLYTSGTTGLPKGVMITNDNCSALLNVADAWSVDESSTCLVAMPLFHIGGSGWALVGLARGGTDLLVPEVDPPALVDLIESARVTNAFLVPAVLQMLTAVPGADQRDFSALRSIAYGASPITTAVLERSMEVFRAPLFQVYGLTESTGAITQLAPQDHDPGGPRRHLLRSAGRAYPWVELRTVDPVTGGDAAPGEVGEVLIRSVQVTPGYWRKPEETAQAIDADGWLHTGDAGYLDEDGYLFLTDRIKDMIVTGAENVYPIEVEDVLAGHPDVADVAVIGVPDEKWGETVKAVVVRREGSDVDADTLVAHARERLAGFKRPRSVDFVDTLPRNPSGKLLKRVLREPYWADHDGRRIG